MSAERCELSELPVEQCACRIHGPREEISTAGRRTYFARFAGRCRECREEIEVGDMIAPSPMADGGFVHEECS